MMISNLAAIWCKTALLALTASERWAAVKQMKPDTSVPIWLIVVTAVALIILLVVSALVINRRQGSRKFVPRR